MNYWQRLCAEQGLHAQTICALVEEVFADPTDSRWRVLGAVLTNARLSFVWEDEVQAIWIDLLAIIKVEREWAHSDSTKP